MSARIHPIGGVIAFLTILAFWASTVASEMLGSREIIAQVKETIPWGFLVLVPALAATALSGIRVAGRSSNLQIANQRRRIPIIVANGLLVVTPAAFYLTRLASLGDFGAWFYSAQAIELVAGSINLSLMSLNIRDGLHLTQRLKGSAEAAGI